MTTPSISLSALEALYDSAFAAYRLEPWAHMNENENFALKAGLKEETFYACVIGAAGISRGIIYYRGAEGWAVFQGLRKGATGAEDALQEIDALALEFGALRDVSPEGKIHLKRLGYGKGSGLHPSPLAYKPGRVPFFPGAEDAEVLTLLLKASLPMFLKSRAEPGWLLDGPRGHLFHVDAVGGVGNPAGEWQKPLQTPPRKVETPPPDELSLARMKGKSLRACPPWEIHLGDSGAVVGDEQGAYFPLLALFADAAAGFIAGVALAPKPDMPQALPRECLKAMQTHGRRPEAFHVKRDDVAAWVEPVAAKLGIPVVRKERLPMGEGALRELRKHMKGR